MARPLAALVAAVTLLGAVAPLGAADSPAFNTWKLPFQVPTQNGLQSATMLFAISDSDGKVVADVLGLDLNLKSEPVITDVSVRDNHVKFSGKLDPLSFSFDGRIAEDGKKIQGSFSLFGSTMLVTLLPSKLKNLNDPYALQRETLDESAGGGEFFNALFPVMAEAAVKKLKADEVRSYADRAGKAAEPYGPRWQRTVALRLASVLAEQEPYVAVAMEQARQAERLLSPADDVATHMQVLDTLARVFDKAGKPDEVRQLRARLAKLEVRDFQEYSRKFPPFKPDPFEGRRGKSDRVALVELFTGAECDACVAFDLACDAMERTYKPAEAVFLQYHVHFPGPDPLANKDSMARSEFYGEKIGGYPTLFVSGRKADSKGGSVKVAKVKYKMFREAIDEYLEKPSAVKLQVAAVRKGDELTVKGTVSDLAKPGEKVTLRFALTEERVRYQGGNGIRYHHNVVRAFPGGAKGFALTKQDSEHSATVNLVELRAALNKELDAIAKEEPGSLKERPMALKNLRVVAFVQDDATGEVLQAATVDAEEKKAD